MRRAQPDQTPKAGMMLSTLKPDVQQLIARHSCDGLHSTDADAAASAQDTAMVLRLTCRTLRAAVDASVTQLDIRATSSVDIERAAARFPGLETIHLRTPAGVGQVKIGQGQLPCLTAVRWTSDDVFSGCHWLDLQHVVAQLTSLTLKYGSITSDAYARWKSTATMLAGLAQLSELRHLDIGNCRLLPTAGSAACTELSALRKLTSLVVWQRPTQHLHVMLPVLRGLRHQRCTVAAFHADGSGALPVLSQLTALEELHMEGQLVGDYKLAFPPALKEFRFVWATREGTEFKDDAAAATLRGMAGRLTALVVPCATEGHLEALFAAGAQLAGTLSSLSLSVGISDATADIYNATDAVYAIVEGLRHVDLELDSGFNFLWDFSEAEIRRADDAFAQLMETLPCCQSLRLGFCGAVSHEAIGRELLRHAQDLTSLHLSIGYFTCEGADTTNPIQELSALTRLTQLHVLTADYQQVSSSLQCLSGLQRLRDVEIQALQAAEEVTNLTAVPPLSHCTALTRLGSLYMPGEAWLPSIAQLSKLPLREVFLDVQWLPHQAAFLAPFQQLGQTLRQLTLVCRHPRLPAPAPAPQTCPSPLEPLQATALRKLILTSMNTPDAMLAGVLEQLPLLKDFEVMRCHTIAAASFANLPVSLRQLRLQQCSGVTPGCLASLGRLPALEHLALADLRSAGGDVALQQLAPHLHAGLSSLEFSGRFVDQEEEQCPEVIPDAQCLTDAGILAFAHALAAANPADRPTLEYLCLKRHPGLGIAAAEALATAPLQSLSRLQLSEGGMDDAGLLHLASHMPQLLHLGVSGCWRITGGGLAAAREAATRCSKGRMVITKVDDEPAAPAAVV